MKSKASEARAQKEYGELLVSGFFYEFYPQLSGRWEEDKDEWLKIYKELTKLRNM